MAKEKEKEEVTFLEDDEICIGHKETKEYWWAFGQRSDKNIVKFIYTIHNSTKADLLISFCERNGWRVIDRKQEPKEDYKMIQGIKRKVLFNNYIVTLEKIPAIQK